MIAAVVLAAGASSRYGTTPPKQQVFLPRVLEALRGVDEVVVVTGAHPVDVDARVVRCAEWEHGPGASLRCGLAALGSEVDAALVVLADGPDLDPRAVERVVGAWRGEDVLAAAYDGVRLHPVLLARAVWGAVPDEGARGLTAVLVACDDLRAPGDVDERTGT
ncbi:MAG: NTP transferase domain-containing protein [Actinomycetota bacterium]